MSFAQRLRTMFYSAGLLMDFRGSRLARIVEERLSRDPVQADREAFRRDGQAIAGDMWRALRRMEEHYGPLR